MTKRFSSRPEPRRYGGGNRRGAILVLAMVCVAVTVSIMTLLVRSAVMHRAAQATQRNVAQANWLVESAMDRAAARLAVDSSYKGETWEIPADLFKSGEPDPTSKPAVVRIKVEPGPNSPSEREVQITADYPNRTPHRVRRSKRVVVQLVTPGPDESGSDSSESDHINEAGGKQP